MTDPGAHHIEAAAARLRAGGLVAFPTETVYGLGADAMRNHPVARVFALKARPHANPLIVHVADEAMANTVAAQWPARASALARALWPGPLTIVVPRAPALPHLVTAAGPTVAVRCPDHPLARRLIESFGGPIVGPSANPSGRTSPTTAAHVRAAFPDAVASGELIVLDGGPCRAGIESTVVSVIGPVARVLRPGVIDADRLAAVLGERIEIAPRRIETASGPMPSPGLLPAHYAPKTPARLVEPGDWSREAARAHTRVVVLARTTPREPPPPGCRVLDMPADAEAYASRLYAALFEADEADAGLILIERPTDTGPLWDAVRDRLSRAAPA